MIHNVLSILILLSPILFLLSIPLFACALWLGAHGGQRSFASGGKALFLAGCLGFLLDVATVVFLLNPHRRLMDSIDSGPFTGVPTLFAAFLSLFILAVTAAMVLRTSKQFCVRKRV